MSNMEGTEQKDVGQRISLLSEEKIDDKDHKDGSRIGIEEDESNEKRKRGWGKLMWWKKDRSVEETESEALMPADTDDDEGQIGGGDISTGGLVYESTADNKETTSIDVLEEQTKETNDDSGENDEVAKEGDLLLLGQSQSKDHSESLKPTISSTSLIETSKSELGFESDSDGSSDEGSESSSEESSDDSSESSSDDDSDSSCADQDNDHSVLKNLSDDRPNLNRRYASTRSFFNNRDGKQITSRPPLSRSLSLRSAYSDSEKQNISQDIDPEGRKRMHGRIEGFGNSVSPEKKSSPKTFRDRFQIFLNNETNGMKKMDTGIQKFSWSDSFENTMNNIADAMMPPELQPFEEGYSIAPVIIKDVELMKKGKTSGMKKMDTGLQGQTWADSIENTMNNIADAVLPPEPYEEGYMIAPAEEIETKTIRKTGNQAKATPVRSELNGEDKNYIKRIEQDLKRKDLEIMCWKNRVKDLEEEVKRLREMIDENVLMDSKCEEDNTGIEWKTENVDLIS